jgi:hypothetical protein
MVGARPASDELDTRSFGYVDLGIRVESRRSHLAWLEEFLCPQFECRPAESFAATVRLREDTLAYESVLGRGPLSDGAVVDCFLNDSHVIRLPRWNWESGGSAVFQESLRILYGVRGDGRQIGLLSPEGNPGARTALMRVVRELAMSHSRQTGGLLLHAAALSLGPRGLIITGPKRAGKTTLLAYLLRETGGSYVSNDRLLVSRRIPRTARGMPTIITLRQSTLDRLASLHRAVLAGAYHYERTLSEVALGGPPPGPWKDGSRGLSPAQFCAGLGVGSQAECTPAVLLFPRIAPEVGAGKLRDLPRDRAVERLRDCLLGGAFPGTTSELFALPTDPFPPSLDELAEMCRELVGRVQCLECELGEDAYGSSTLAAECVRAIA